MSPDSQLPRQIPGMNGANSPPAKCVACENHHPTGSCPLKLAGVEYCPLCGIAHFGRGRVCPHLKSITQLQTMQDAIKYSPESSALKELTKKKLTGLIGSIRYKRELEAEAKAARESHALWPSGQPGSNFMPQEQLTTSRPVASRQMNGRRDGKVNKEARLHAPPLPYRQ